MSNSRFYGFDTRHSTVTLYNKMYARIAIFFGYTVSYYEFILTNLFNAQTLYMGRGAASHATYGYFPIATPPPRLRMKIWTILLCVSHSTFLRGKYAIMIRCSCVSAVGMLRRAPAPVCPEFRRADETSTHQIVEPTRRRSHPPRTQV